MRWLFWHPFIWVFLASISAQWCPNIWPKIRFPDLFWDPTDPVNLIIIYDPSENQNTVSEAYVNPGLTIWVQTSILVQFIWYRSFNLLDCVCWPVFMFVFLPSIAGLCGPIFARNGGFQNHFTQWPSSGQNSARMHHDVIKWKYFPRYCPFVRGSHRSPVNSPHKGQWRGALMFSLICVWLNG